MSSQVALADEGNRFLGTKPFGCVGAVPRPAMAVGPGDGGVIGEAGTLTSRIVRVRGSNPFRDVELSDTVLEVGVGGLKSGGRFCAASGSPCLDRVALEGSSDNRKTSRATAARSSSVEASSWCGVETGVVGSSVDRK